MLKIFIQNLIISEKIIKWKNHKIYSKNPETKEKITKFPSTSRKKCVKNSQKIQWNNKRLPISIKKEIKSTEIFSLFSGISQKLKEIAIDLGKCVKRYKEGFWKNVSTTRDLLCTHETLLRKFKSFLVLLVRIFPTTINKSWI